MADGDPGIRVRWPQPGDEQAAFEAGGGLARRTGWPAVLESYSPSTGRFVWIAESDSAVVGLATGRVWPDELNIELLARNALARVAPGQRVGHFLLESAVALAWAFKLPWVTLEALDDRALLAFYEGEGFLRDGPPLFDAAWGTLHPMRRSPWSWPP